MTLVQMSLSWFLECTAALAGAPEVTDHNCLRLGIAEITIVKQEGVSPFKHWYIRVKILKIILCCTGNQRNLHNTGVI